MSNIKAKRVQIGISAPASPHPNFTIFQPDTPDGTMRIRNADAGDAGTDLFTFLGAAAPDLEIGGRKIAEYGSNANGEYVRLYNGVQICFHNNLFSYSTGDTNVHAASWTFPAAFAGVEPVVKAHPWSVDSVDGYMSITTVRSLGLTSCRVMGKKQQASGAVRYQVQAIGRWY